MTKLRSIVSAALLSLLVLAAVGPALAAPLADTVLFSLDVNPTATLLGAKPICIGQTINFYVSANRITSRRVGSLDVDSTTSLYGVTVTGSIANGAIGSLELVGPGMTGRNAEAFNQVVFRFKAEKAGLTTLKFKGLFEAYWVPAPAGTLSQLEELDEGFTRQVDIPIKVQPCKAKTSTVQRWSGPGYTLVGTMAEAELTAGEDGTLHGAGTVTWVASTVVPNCLSTDDFAPSPVDLTGVFNADGQLTLDLTFEPAVDSASIYCEMPGIGVTEDRDWTVLASPDPLNVAVSGDGGTLTQPQRIVGSQSDAQGLALIIVQVETEEAAANAASALTQGWPRLFDAVAGR